MANEAVTIELLGNGGNPIRFTVADGTTIEKGVICKMTDPRTAAASGADNDVFAGIAAAEKVANDGATTLALYTKGIFDLYSDGGNAITIGQDVAISGANIIKGYTTLDKEKGYIVGRALETVTAGTAETIAVAVGVY